MNDNRTLAELGRDAYTLAKDAAMRQVDGGRLAPSAAHAKLRPWLAIAAWCGADLQELWQFCTPIFGPVTAQCPIFAHEIAPRSEWAAVLAEARDAALDRLTPESTVEKRHHARTLCALANALALDPNGTHPIPPYGAQQRKAA